MEVFIFFFKQKTAYEMRISDWSSDVCSSDLVDSAIAADPAIEARVREIVAGMTLAQKVGQMTQAEIKSVTPEQVREYYIGSVLNGGGSWPGQDKSAKPTDWAALAARPYDASTPPDMPVLARVIWGPDAVPGTRNVTGVPLLPP